MITTDFMGDYDPKFNTLIFKDNNTMYNTAKAFLLIVVLLIPGMLLTKPLVAGYCSNHDDADKDEIEFTNINRGDELQQPLNHQKNYQALANDEDNSKRITAEMINIRQN